MSDSATIQAILDQAATGATAVIPPGNYTITAPLALRYSTSTFGGGVLGYGVQLRSALPPGVPLLTISVVAGMFCRGQKFAGFDIVGNKADGHGLAINAAGDLYNFVFRDIGVENCGGDGVNATGAIFEGYFENVRPRGNKGNGATLGNGAAGGVMSTVAWVGGSCGQNGRYGMELVNEAYDVKARDTYFLLNGLAGLHCLNGIFKLDGGGFENNQQSLPAGQAGPAVQGENFGTFVGCSEGAEDLGGGKRQTSFADGFYLVSDLLLVGVRSQNVGTIGNKGRVTRIGGTGAIAVDPGVVLNQI